MRTYANWKSAVITLVAFCLVITQIELAAFAQQGQPANPPASAPQTQSQTPPPAPAPSAQGQAKPRSGHRRFKWLLIGAAAVGAVAVILLTRKKSEPTVTVGGPTVGNPQ